jgi:hypothetical protein
MSLTPCGTGNTNMCSLLNTLVESGIDRYCAVLKTASNTSLTYYIPAPTSITKRARNDRCCVPLQNYSMTSLLSLLKPIQFPMMPDNYSVYSFAAIECLWNSIRRLTQETVASFGDNVALGDFVRLAEATVCCPGDGDAPQGSKG